MVASLAERLTETLRGRVISGALTPGSVVIEPALAQEFQVSKTPVREALQRLTHEGYVEVLPKRGYLVRGLTQADVRDVVEVRGLLEPAAAAHVARLAARGDAEAETALKLLTVSLTKAEGVTQPLERLHASLAFHRTLAQLTPNARLREPLTHAIDEYLRAINVVPELRERALESFDARADGRLLEAIREGDAAAAQDVLEPALRGASLHEA